MTDSLTACLLNCFQVCLYRIAVTHRDVALTESLQVMSDPNHNHLVGDS